MWFSVTFSIAITSLGEERANLSAFRTFVRFVRLFDLCLFEFVGFFFLLWHFLDFSLTFFATKNVFFLSLLMYTIITIYGRVKKSVMPLFIFWIIFFIRFGPKLYRQTIGIPMGTKCAPLVADCFFFVIREIS